MLSDYQTSFEPCTEKMAVPSNKGCRSCVDDIYWNHFQFLHFAQFLRTGYDQHLEIPKTFSENLKKLLPKNVGLRGPGGVVWDVGLTMRDDTLYFMHGWEQFVKDHYLKENDFLVFKYNGESLFDVLIFDGENFCEKAASYFVRKCGHTEHAPSNAGVGCSSHEKSLHGNSIKVPAAVPSETPGERTFNVGVESATPEQFVDADADGVTVTAAVHSQTTNERTGKLGSAVEHVQTKRRGRPPKESNAH